MKLKRNYWLSRGDGKGPMHGAYFEDYTVAHTLACDVVAGVRTGPDLVCLHQLMTRAAHLQGLYHEWSYGQCIFNALDRLAPDIAELLRYTEADPSQDDTRINAMIKRFFKERG